MADEIPPAPSESVDDLTKGETIRITLPPKSDQPAVKRETVRINVPGKPSPKKETTKLVVGGEAAGAAPAPAPAPAKPFIPPPPTAKPLPTPPPPATKPLSGVNPPKPPTLGARPTVPLKPAPAPMAGGPTPAPAMEPVTQKAAAPKKETARITLPPEGAKASLPKATVKMQQTQPLAPRPSAIQQAPALAQAPSAAVSTTAVGDPLLGPLSIAALVAVLAAVVTAYLAFAATTPV